MRDTLALLVAGRGEDVVASTDATTTAHALAALTSFWRGDHCATTAAATQAAACVRDGVDDWLAAGALGLAAAGDPAAAGHERWDVAGTPPPDGPTGAFARYLVAEAALACARLDVADRISAAGPWHEPWHGHPYEVMMLSTSVRIAAFAGRIDDADRLLTRAQDAARRHGLERLTSAVSVLVHGNADRPAETRPLAEQLLAADVPPHDYLGRGLHLLAAFGAVAIGDLQQAASLVLVAGADGFDRLTIVDRALAVELLVAAAEADGDLDTALTWLDQAAGIRHHRAAQPTIDRARSRTAAMAGDWDDAVRLAERAVRLARREGRAIEAAEGEIVLARARIGNRDVPAAGRALREQVAASDAAGHHAMRRSAGQVLRPLGRRLPPVAAGGWDVLSPREREVADLILAGRSQAAVAAELYLSLGTVRAHVARVLRAFGVGSRVALLAALGPRGEPSPRPAVPLTPRQQQVVTLLAAGASNGEIATALDISVKAVEKHVGDARLRWSAGDRFELARTWLSVG